MHQCRKAGFSSALYVHVQCKQANHWESQTEAWVRTRLEEFLWGRARDYKVASIQKSISKLYVHVLDRGADVQTRGQAQSKPEKLSWGRAWD